jgi:alanine dehydrogenase
LHRLKELDLQFGSKLNTIYANTFNIEKHVAEADLVVGAVLIPGSSAPKLVSEDMVKSMRQGSVLVDVAIDQGGCFETSRPTSHSKPTYSEHGVIHYCVTNMPGAVPRTATFALNNATLPFALSIADKGWKAALAKDDYLRDGLNVCHGKITHKAVAESVGQAFVEPSSLL